MMKKKMKTKAKTTKLKVTKAAPKVEHDSETTFRVVPLSNAARRWVANSRSTSVGPNNQEVIAYAVTTALPSIVKALRALGLGRSDVGDTKKFRLPFDPATIQALRDASDSLPGVPATMLLELAILSHVTKGAK